MHRTTISSAPISRPYLRMTLLEGTPRTLSESYAERRAFVRQRRTQTAARRERRERDQARRAGGATTDADPTAFAEVVEAAVATVSAASAPVVEALPARQQRPRRRSSEASSGTEQGSGNGASHVVFTLLVTVQFFDIVAVPVGAVPNISSEVRTTLPTSLIVISQGA